ncbi:hypothetical protein [Butyrivibrio sp. FCS014]|uniref:hypothetical protein n=1 Tax=Butyrivibrio sp. FCS014 TaxID=1408304 RepID=UPI000466F324|nr:hypothetical protein [Butyrivibrio sp. FCS014]
MTLFRRDSRKCFYFAIFGKISFQKSLKRDAEEHGLYLCGCYKTGCEILNMSNPGDYPLDEDDDVDFEVVKV